MATRANLEAAEILCVELAEGLLKAGAPFLNIQATTLRPRRPNS
jgi:hypothetical protein